MKTKRLIKQIVLSGIMTALAVIVGMFAHFYFLGGQVFLVAIIIFLMPLLFKLNFLIINTVISVVLVDLLNNWITYTWISIIAYLIAVLTIWTCKHFKLKIFYMVGTLTAAGLVVLIYYLLEKKVFGEALAIDDLYATSLEMAITLPVVWILYFPIKIIGKV
ncbi:MAG: hypothetical protein NC236_02165 [Mycoplasma sp.]|nr:hypothetical protein [Mycoplasma sp.]